MQLYTHLEIDIYLRPVRFHPGQAFLEQLCHAIRIKHYSCPPEKRISIGQSATFSILKQSPPCRNRRRVVEGERHTGELAGKVLRR